MQKKCPKRHSGGINEITKNNLCDTTQCDQTNLHWKHNIEDMQSDYDNYGEDYSLYLLDEIRVFSERSKEYEWMEKLNSHIRGSGYNYKDRAMVERKKKLPLKAGVPTVRKEG